jgi:hypothetical protein
MPALDDLEVGSLIPAHLVGVVSAEDGERLVGTDDEFVIVTVTCTMEDTVHRKRRYKIDR